MSVLYVDLETVDARTLYSATSGFVRLAGFAVDNGPVVVTADIDRVVAAVRACDVVVAHNGIGFDLAALHRFHGLDVDRLVNENRVFDTLLAARQEWPPLSGGVGCDRYGLDAVAARLHLDGKLVGAGGESALKALEKRYGGFDMIPVEDSTYRDYLRRDVEVLREVAQRLPFDMYVAREARVLWRLQAITRQGFRVDRALAEYMVADYEQQRIGVVAQLGDEFGLPVSGAKPWSTKRGRECLERVFSELGVVPPRTSTGALALGRDALEELARHYVDNEGLQRLCSLLVVANSTRSTAQTVLDHCSSDGRVHPEVSASQATGRLSVTKPGLTVVGKRDRRNVLERSLLLPDPGDVLLCCDLSAIDARAMAICSGDAAYARALAPGRDLHDAVAAVLFGPHSGDGHHPRRSDAKQVTHGTSYGMGARRLAAGTGMSEFEAEALLLRLDVQYPKLAALKQRVRDQASVPGAVLTTPAGRRIRVDPSRAYTAAPAALGQGLARDLLAEAVLRLPDWLVACLRGVVHDELVVSVPEDRAGEAQAALLHAMQFGVKTVDPDVTVPVLAECSPPGRDWLDCYREEKPWPEVARSHREQPSCDDPECTWHRSPHRAAELLLSSAKTG